MQWQANDGTDGNDCEESVADHMRLAQGKQGQASESLDQLGETGGNNLPPSDDGEDDDDINAGGITRLLRPHSRKKWFKTGRFKLDLKMLIAA